jgi:hypothetical protein
LSSEFLYHFALFPDYGILTVSSYGAIFDDSQQEDKTINVAGESVNIGAPR